MINIPMRMYEITSVEPDMAKPALAPIPRSQVMLSRARTIVNRIAQLAGVDQALVARLTITANYNTTASSHPAYDTTQAGIALNPYIFYDAPDSVLAFVIGHEVGHIVNNAHSIQGKTSTHPGFDREYDADEWGANMAKKLGYNKAEAVKWIQDKRNSYEVDALDDPEITTGHEDRLGRFTPYSDPSDHPSWTYRKKRLRDRVPGFELAMNQIQQAITAA